MNNHQGGRFMDGFILGLLVGGIAVFLFGTEKGKKVLTQSFGSNHKNNLILACKNCNLHKKHRMEKEVIQKVLKTKF